MSYLEQWANIENDVHGSTVAGWIHPYHGQSPSLSQSVSVSVTIEVGGKGPRLGWRSSYKFEEPSWCGTLGEGEVKGSPVTGHGSRVTMGSEFLSPNSAVACRDLPSPTSISFHSSHVFWRIDSLAKGAFRCLIFIGRNFGDGEV